MTPRERFRATLGFRLPDDRLPMIEWAPWWDRTWQRWRDEGLDGDGGPGAKASAGQAMLGLDPMQLIAARGRGPNCPNAPSHGAGIVASPDDYDALKPHLFADATIDAMLDAARRLKPQHDRGELVIRLWLDGYFWFPRTLFGIEAHLFAFYDEPELMHRMNDELTAFNLRAFAALCDVLTPDLVGFAEDMSYNNGPMLSAEQFREFLTPYYQRVIPPIREAGVPVMIDSDGDITRMIPWMQEAGIEGVYPLERQAGVDLVAIREQYPRFLLMGGYDKMVMSKGEAAMRAEFERLLPVMRSGGYIPSVDHQTPPEVSLENYRSYLRLFREYAERACTSG